MYIIVHMYVCVCCVCSGVSAEHLGNIADAPASIMRMLSDTDSGLRLPQVYDDQDEEPDPQPRRTSVLGRVKNAFKKVIDPHNTSITLTSYNPYVHMVHMCSANQKMDHPVILLVKGVVRHKGIHHVINIITLVTLLVDHPEGKTKNWVYYPNHLRL